MIVVQEFQLEHNSYTPPPPPQGSHMDRLFTISYLPVCLLILSLMIWLGPGLIPLQSRITFGFVGFVLVTLLVPLVDILLVSGHAQAPWSALCTILTAVVLIGVLDGICQGAVFVDASQSGMQCTHVRGCGWT